MQDIVVEVLNVVKRSGFFLKDGCIARRDVVIEWNLGFEREAKKEYVRRLHLALGSELHPIIDVTTASNDYLGRGLSPFYTKIGDENVETLWASTKEQFRGRFIPGLFDYVYLHSLTDEQKQYVLQRKCFTDVFFNPDKACNTQAKSLVVYQLLVYQEKLELLDNLQEFVKWSEKNEKVRIVK